VKSSPLQLELLKFNMVSIEVDTEYAETIPDTNSDFDFDGVNFQTGIDVQRIEGRDKRDHFLNFLQFSITNEDGKKCPYKVHIVVAAVITVSESIPAAKRENLARVNGAALLFGAAREMVANITSRSAAGALMLPTVNFIDEAIPEKEGQMKTLSNSAEGSGASGVAQEGRKAEAAS
jgi:preprotein translocase subunit SecB